MPFAGDTPSGQQPNLVSLHVSLTVHPSSNGPLAAVLLSAQQPNSLARQAAGFVRILHLRGFSSSKMIESNELGVVLELHKSSSSLVDDQMSVVEYSEVDSVLSVAPLSLVLLESVLLKSVEYSLVDPLDDSLDDSLVD